MALSMSRIGLFLLVVLLVGSLAGCAKHRAKTAFEEAEELFQGEKYDQAVEKYFAAAKEDPTNITYKMKLQAGRTRAAAKHINTARTLVKNEQFEEALAQYLLARELDPSLEVAALEAKSVQAVIDARKQLEEAFVRYREKKFAAARKIVTDVLKVDPQNAKAIELQEQLDARRHAVFMDGVELDLASNEPINLKFKQANIKDVFGILTQLAGITFILDDEIKEKAVTISLEKATFSQAMELVLSMAGLDKKVLNSKTMIVYQQSKDKEKQYEDQIIQNFFLSHIDAKKAVNLLRTMLQLRKVYVHEERNALVIRDTPETIMLAERLLKAADRADSEVLFDVEVLAVRDIDSLNFGPKLAPSSVGAAMYKGDTRVASTLLGTVDAATATLVGSLNGLDMLYTLPAASFDFAKTLDTTEILASPKIRVKNNEKAKVHIGKRDPIVTETTVSGTSNSTQNVQYVDSGIKLDIEPNVQLDGTVLTKITLEVSQAERLNKRDETGTSPVALTLTNAQTSLVLIDGARTILGGLYETNSVKSRSTIPFLGDIPLIGSLLTNFANSEDKREIILSITPYIVKKVEIPADDVATIWSGGEEDLMTKPKFGAFAEELQSEVESTTPSASPAKPKTRPAPSSALQGKTSPFPGLESLPQELAAQQAAAVPPPVATPAAPLPPEAFPVAPVTPTAPPPGTRTADSLLPQSSPVQPGKGQTPVAPAPIVPVTTPPAVPAPVVPTAGVTTSPPATPVPGAPQPATAEPAQVLPLPPKAPPRLDIGGPETAGVGAEVALNVQVSGMEKLFSAPLFVSYDPALLELVGVEEGGFLKQNGQTTVFSNSPNPATGQVVVGYKQGVGGAGASGSGSLFTLRFRGKAAGTAKVEVNRLNFRDPAGTRLAIEPAATSIVVR